MIQDVLANAVRYAAMGFEFFGLLTIVLVSSLATVRFMRQIIVSDWSIVLPSYRANLGRGVLLGLELLIAADILRTVAAPSTFGNLGLLAAIVLIRTFLNISLGLEIEGAWPWRRRELERQRGEIALNAVGSQLVSEGDPKGSNANLDMKHEGVPVR